MTEERAIRIRPPGNKVEPPAWRAVRRVRHTNGVNGREVLASWLNHVAGGSNGRIFKSPDPIDLGSN